MSGPNPPEPGGQPTEEFRDELTDTGFSRAYSAPEAEQYAIAPYLPADLELYDYDSYDQGEASADLAPPRWPWVVGVTAIIAAIALVVSVSLLVTRRDTRDLASPATTTTQPPPVQDAPSPPLARESGQLPREQEWEWAWAPAWGQPRGPPPP